MTTVIKFKKSTTVSSVPTTGDLEDGEIAVNIADKKIYIRNGASIVELANYSAGGGGGGGSSIQWQSLYTSDGSTNLNATSNYGYFIDTTSGALTINLPGAPSAGDTIPIIDATGTSATNNISVNPNGNKIFGSSNPKLINVNKSGYVFVYSDSTRGWVISEAYSEPDAGLVGTPGAPTIGTATIDVTTASISFTAPTDDGGSTITGYTATSSPGGLTGTLSQAGSGTVQVSGLSLSTTYTFTITASNQYGTGPSSAASNSVTTPGELFISATGGTVTYDGDYKIHTFTGSDCFEVTQLGINACGPVDKVSYMVVAGGGGGARNHGGSGGAGGFREGKVPSDPYTASPLDAGCGISVTAGPTVYPIGVGGGGGLGYAEAYNGGGSTFSTISASGGGGGGGRNGRNQGTSGGSGAGGAHNGHGGSGNSGGYSPPEGNPGHPSAHLCGGRGGSASAAGGGTSRSALPGVNSSITGSSIGYSSAAGAGGHGQGSPANPSDSNRGGSGYGGHAGFGHGQSGRSGVVVIRYKYQ